MTPDIQCFELGRGRMSPIGPSRRRLLNGDRGKGAAFRLQVRVRVLCQAPTGTPRGDPGSGDRHARTSRRVAGIDGVPARWGITPHGSRKHPRVFPAVAADQRSHRKIQGNGTCALSIRSAAKFLNFSPPRPCASIRIGYSSPEPRIRLVLGRSIVQNLAGHAGSAQLRDATSSLYSGLLPKSHEAGDRRTCPASAARNVRPEAIEAQAHTAGSRLLGCSVPVVASLEGCPGHRQARHGNPAAPQGLPSLLASDLEARPRAAADLRGGAGARSPTGARERLAGGGVVLALKHAKRRTVAADGF